MKILNLVLCLVVVILLNGCAQHYANRDYCNAVTHHNEKPLIDRIGDSEYVSCMKEQREKQAAEREKQREKQREIQEAQRFQEQRNQQLFNERQEQAKQQTYINQIQNTCVSFGFTPGTDNFANCMMNQDRLIKENVSQQQLIDAANKSANAAQRSLEMKQREEICSDPAAMNNVYLKTQCNTPNFLLNVPSR